MRLGVHTGVGTSSLDLFRLPVSDVDVNTGVGATTITLPGRGQTKARINGGVGEVEISIPEGVAARLQVRAGLGSASVVGDYQRQEDLYVSPGYDTARDRVDQQINGGVGKVTVRGSGPSRALIVRKEGDFR